MPLVDDFKARFVEFEEADVDRLWPSLSLEWPCLYGADYGQDDCDDQIILNIIAHLLFIELQASQASRKDAVSKSVGSVSVSYAQGDSGRLFEYFNTTKYGQRALMLMNKNQGAFFV